MENPYREEDLDEDEDDEADGAETLVGSGNPSWVGPYPGKSDFAPQSRNASSTSLRSRSTTGDSGGAGLPTPTPSSMSMGAGRAPPPRFAQGALQGPQHSIPLTLRTQQLAALSP
ncbi:Guanine nucleotide exchange factor for Cdc42p, partial [Teratosphaeriaceae sp. CCFEE 6253]